MFMRDTGKLYVVLCDGFEACQYDFHFANKNDVEHLICWILRCYAHRKV